MAKWDEVELIERARAGDGSAREILYLTYFARNKQVRGLLSREVPNEADREDILHDAYLSLVRSKAPFRGDSKLQTFVYRVAQIAILQWLRARRAARDDKMVRLTYEMEGEERHRELAIEDYQFEEVNAGATAEKLYSFIPEPLRTTFRLRVSEELTYEEIAARTGTPINTVATRIFKARTLLARLFGGPEGNKTPGGGN
ncbi:MAG: sigma-70 family RNA polymerase sigma factor [Bryobacteraceae bacterium]